MFTLNQLKSVLDSQGLTIDSARLLNRRCGEMFFGDSNLSSYLAWSPFRSLSDLWNDQAVLTVEIQPFIDRLLPALIEWTHSDELFSDVGQMRNVVKVFWEADLEVSKATTGER